jgi:hypothetical protein
MIIRHDMISLKSLLQNITNQKLQTGGDRAISLKYSVAFANPFTKGANRSAGGKKEKSSRVTNPTNKIFRPSVTSVRLSTAT